jgi:hypothetical protein
LIAGSRTLAVLGPLVAGTTLAIVAACEGCGPACRAIDVQPLPLECTAFDGDLHLDDPVVWESFLEIQCLPDVSREALEELVASVDMSEDAVFVSAGVRAPQPGRCIEGRAVAAVEVCDDGLRVAFDDEVSAADPCTGSWTVAFALPRSELRAALADEEEDETGTPE